MSPPSKVAVSAVFAVAGTALAAVAGGGQKGPAIASAEEMVPTACVSCLFLLSYSVLDVIAVGDAKSKYGDGGDGGRVPEEVRVAQRAQANQVEQLPGFLVGSFAFSYLVNPRVGAALSLVWAVLRRLYAKAYRNGVHNKNKAEAHRSREKYFKASALISNSMLAGAVAQSCRLWWLQGK